MSNLTLGASEAFSGNPLKAMRHRRKKQFINEVKTKDGQKVFQEKGILELFDEFNKFNQGDEEYSANVSVDSFEIQAYQDGEDEDEDKEKWQLPLLDDERYILGSDDEDKEDDNKLRIIDGEENEENLKQRLRTMKPKISPF